jgi:outer membrane lipoprotein-sorting protein
MFERNRSHRISLALLALLVAFAGQAANAQAALSGQEVMDKVSASAKPAGSVITMTMVVSKGGQSLTRTLTTWTTGDNAKGETERTLMKFLSPADVKGSGFLNLKKADGSAESLLWLPALGRVRRLGSGSSDQDQAFFGSDFTNRDINGFVQADFGYAVASFEGGVYTVVATPKKSLGYEKLVYQVDSSMWKYTKIDYWRSGKLAKSQSVDYERVGAYFMPSRIAMSSASGSRTELRFTDYKLDQAIGDQVFTERFLKQ